jgi:hypothetical protein
MNTTVDRTILLNWWLNKYYNTNTEEVLHLNPRAKESSDWFNDYQVTQEQYDEWEKWAIAYIKKVTKFPLKKGSFEWGLIVLDCSPRIKRDGNRL